jgi:hypothetical protein
VHTVIACTHDAQLAKSIIHRVGALALAVLGFLGLATFPGWHEEIDARTGDRIDIKAFPSSKVSLFVAIALGAASLLLMVSALWQHVAAASVVALMSSTAQGKDVVAHAGLASMALGWMSFALATLAFQGIVISTFYVGFLDRLTGV